MPERLSTPRPAGAAAVAAPAEAAAAEALEFTREQAPRVLKYLINSGCPPPLAEEITSDGSLIVIDRWERLRADPRFAGTQPRSYQFHVSTNLWRRYGPAETRWRQGLAGLVTDETVRVPAPAVGLDEAVVDRLTAQAVVGVTLPLIDRPHRQVLWLRLAEQFSGPETAKILTISPGTVKSRLHYAVRRYRDLLIASGTLEGTQWDVRT
ncbi:MAG: sigma-70 family RNA polymerase sigma factor [Actinobacteria bacterium]|nr:sigma-70 family RNA polymerase sigma factor [Actinomycetota bacterium]